MKILVTGGTGFLGKNLQVYFQDHWEEFLQTHPDAKIHFAGRSCGAMTNGHYNCYDLTTESGAMELMQDSQPDVIIMAAANVGGIGKNKRLPATLCHDNLLINLNTFKAAHVCQVPYICVIGSTCQYPMYCKTPFRESDLWNGASEITNRPYSEAKRIAFTLHDAYREQYGLKGCKLIPSNLYGPYDNFDLNDSHVVPALIKKFVEAKQKNLQTVECWGKGIATRDLLYAEDVAEGIFFAIKNQLDANSPINLGTGVETCVGDLAYLIAEMVEYTGEIVFTGEVSDGQLRRCLDTTLAQKILGFKSKTSLKDGLRKTIEWYINNEK